MSKPDPKQLQHMVACNAHIARLDAEPATQQQMEAAARALGLDQRWPPVQQPLDLTTEDK